MATAQDLINVALSFNGYDRSDAALFRNDYASRHGAEFAGYNVPYCDIFVTFCSRQVGLPDADSAYVPGRVNRARSEGMLVDTYSGAVGDFVTFDWDDDGVDDHIGIIVGGDSAYYYTIEGNTSSESQGNGGMVQQRTRARSIVSHIIRPHYDGYPTQVTQSWNPTEALKGIQRALQLDDDGVLGPLTNRAVYLVVAASNWAGNHFPEGVAATQALVGTEPDGIWGDASEAAHDRTVEAMQRALGVDDDGIWGPETQAAWERVAARAELP